MLKTRTEHEGTIEISPNDMTIKGEGENITISPDGIVADTIVGVLIDH